MKFNLNRWTGVTLMIAVAVFSFSCTNEFTQSAAPVELVVTSQPNLQILDVDPEAANCLLPIATINFRALLKAPIGTVDQRFNDVRISRYRVSYVRTDGGTLVPAPFVRSVDLLVPAGGTATLPNFQAFQGEAVFQQPLVSLLPQNGGRDPETGRTVVRMDLVVEFFGETLAGANVAGRTRIPLDFCFRCGGCR